LIGSYSASCDLPQQKVTRSMEAVQTDGNNYRSLGITRVCFLVAYAVALDPIQSWDAAKVFMVSEATTPTAYSNLISSRCLQTERCYGKVSFQ
jgi:hypothetical protein